MEMSQEGIIASTRELLTSYQALIQVVPNQEPIFIVKHLAKLFDKEPGTSNTINIIINNPHTKYYDIIMRIRAAYKEFNDSSDAMELVTNLEEILIQNPVEPTTKLRMDCDDNNIDSTDTSESVQTKMQQTVLAESTGYNKNQREEEEETPLVTTTSVQHIHSKEGLEQKQKRRKGRSSHEKYYECPYCHGLFLKREDLKAHRKFHMRPSFFPCKFCSRSFAQTHSLKFHEHRCLQNLILKPKDQLITQEMALIMSKCFRSPSSRSCSSKLVSDFPFVKPLPPHSMSNGVNKRKRDTVNSTSSTTATSQSEDLLPYVVIVARNEATGEKRKLYKCSSAPDCTKQFSSRSFLFNHLRFHAEEADEQQNSNNNNNVSTSEEEMDLEQDNLQSSEESSSESDSFSLKGSRSSRAKIHRKYPSRNTGSQQQKVKIEANKPKLGERTSPRKLNRDQDGKFVKRKVTKSSTSSSSSASSSSSSAVVFKLKSPLISTKRQRQRQRLGQSQTEKNNQRTEKRGRKPKGIGSHVCSYCGQTCVDQGKLKVHIRIHTGERPFSCKHCSREFATSSNCRVHERLHEKKGSFKRRTTGSLVESERTI